MESYSAEFASRSLAERVALYQPRDEYGHLFTPEAMPINRLLAGERLAGNEAVNVRLCTLDRREVLVTITGTPFYDEQEQIRGAVCILRDVTEQKHMRRRLQILDALDEA